MNSSEFDAIAPSTKVQYLHNLKGLRERLGAGRLCDIDTDTVDRYTDKLTKQCGTSVADAHRKLINAIWKACRIFPQFNLKGKVNPTLEAKRRYKVKRAHRPWPREAQEKFMATAPAYLRLAKLLLHFSAQRGCDCVKMLWSDYDGQGLMVRQRKTHGDADAMANYHVCPKPLREALDRAPRTAETILVNQWGKPFKSANILGKAIRRELVRAGLAKHGERTLVMHGLRKAAASDVGSLGVGAAGVKSVGGWKSDEEANYYARYADQRRVNEMVVQQWDAEIERQEREQRAREQRSKIRAVS
jgi:integrase